MALFITTITMADSVELPTVEGVAGHTTEMVGSFPFLFSVRPVLAIVFQCGLQAGSILDRELDRFALRFARRFVPEVRSFE